VILENGLTKYISFISAFESSSPDQVLEREET